MGNGIGSMLGMASVDLEKYRDKVIEVGIERRKCQSNFSHADFLAGAMVLYFETGNASKIPAAWIMNTLAGRDPFMEADDE